MEQDQQGLCSKFKPRMDTDASVFIRVHPWFRAFCVQVGTKIQISSLPGLSGQSIDPTYKTLKMDHPDKPGDDAVKWLSLNAFRSK